MKRREFIKSSLTASLAGVTTLLGAAEKPAREFYELRLYHLRRGPKQKVAPARRGTMARRRALGALTHKLTPCSLGSSVERQLC